jgi:putative Mg2+ transporter-C (MgtC) family protein
MFVSLGWPDILVRLVSAMVADALIVLDRGEHGRPAGLRTMLLASLAACLAMIQANLLLGTGNKPEHSFVTLDMM